ncbi:MAG: Ig-like domain-containing protein [Armatimonadia bacterium]
MRFRSGLLICIALAVILLAGCGGGGGGTTSTGSSGSMSFRVTFPPLPEVSTAHIPGPLMSLGLDIIDPATQTPKVERVVINRPSPAGGVVNVTVPDVHTGPTKVVCKGYEQENCAGIVIAYAETVCTVNLNQTVPIVLTLNNTVHHLVINGQKWVVVGSKTDLTGTAYDVEEGIVSATLVWSSLDTTKATVDPDTGTVTGVAPGNVTIRLTDTGSGITKDFMMVVEPVIVSLTIDPTGTHTLNIDQALNLTVTANAASGPVEGIDISFVPNETSKLRVVKTGVNTATVTALAESTSPTPVRVFVTHQPTVMVYSNFLVTSVGGIGIDIR